MTHDDSDDSGENGQPAGHDTRRSRADARDETLLELLADGYTHVQAAEFARCSAKTVQRRLSDDDFARELARRRAIRLSDLAGQFSQLTDEALEVLVDTLHVDSAALRLRAALAIFKMRLGLHDEQVNEQRLARLEAQANQRPPADDEFPRWTSTPGAHPTERHGETTPRRTSLDNTGHPPRSDDGPDTFPAPNLWRLL